MRLLGALLTSAMVAVACGGDSDEGGAQTTRGESSTSTTEATTASATSGAIVTTSTTAASAGPCEGGDVSKGPSTFTVEAAGNTYDVSAYIPTGHDGRPLPLLMDFHGLGSSGPEQASFSEFTTLAQAEDFVLVNPTGLKVGEPSEVFGGAVPNSWELGQSDTDARDDVAMVAALIDAVAGRACIDDQRIYAAGMSNGGLFSSYLACELADRIAATFSVAGITHHDGCSPSQPIAMGAVHGTADEVVTFDGSGSSLLTDDTDPGQADFFAQVMPDEVAEFAADFACSEPVDTAIGDDTTKRTYDGCEGGVRVEFYIVEGGGHTWPGSTAAKLFESRLGYATDDFDTSEVAWAFLSEFTLADS